MKKFIIVFVILISLGGIFAYHYGKFYDGKLHVVFCDVGQGDAIFIRTPKGLDVLVDGGPDDKVLSCLSSHMPFWDRDLELVILTHPHADHLSGLISVARHYKILSFATENLRNNTVAFVTLMDELKNQNIAIRYVYAGDRFVFKEGFSLNIVGPSREFLEKTSASGLIGERNEFANVESLIKYKDFWVLLTGDSQASELSEALRLVASLLAQGKISILQVPHHGSKTGLNAEILEVLSPKLAVISVGKHNKYGHPTPSILETLRNKEIKILRTDEHGEVEITSNGK